MQNAGFKHMQLKKIPLFILVMLFSLYNTYSIYKRQLANNLMQQSITLLLLIGLTGMLTIENPWCITYRHNCPSNVCHLSPPLTPGKKCTQKGSWLNSYSKITMPGSRAGASLPYCSMIRFNEERGRRSFVGCYWLDRICYTFSWEDMGNSCIKNSNRFLV